MNHLEVRCFLNRTFLISLSVVLLQICRGTNASYDCSTSFSQGVTEINLDDKSATFLAYCDQKTESGGWTVILNRTSSELSFTKRTEFEWRNGIGDLLHDHFLGLDKFAAIANSRSHEMLIELKNDNEKVYRRYRGLRLRTFDWKLFLTKSMFDKNSSCSVYKSDSEISQDGIFRYSEDSCLRHIFDDYHNGIYFGSENEGSKILYRAIRLLIRPENKFLRMNVNFDSPF